MPEHPNSFDARDTLKVGDSRAHDLPPRRAAVEVRRGAAALQPQGAAREPAAHRGQRLGHRRTTSRSSRAGTRRPSRARRSPSRPRAWSCRTSPACRPSSTWPPCATRWPTWAATRAKINPLVPAELVIDHSVQVDVFGTRDAFRVNAEREFERNQERYAFLRWGQDAFDNFSVVPPDTGIVHQVNLEYLARVVFVDDKTGMRLPRHAGRHRLAHDDDQRPRRAGLGRGRHRGRGGDAGPADVDAHPAGARLQAPRRAARGRHGDRPRAHGHRAAAQEGRRRQVRRVLRPGRVAPAAGRPRDDRQHEPRVRLDVRDLPRSTARRCATWPSRAAPRSSSSSSRPTPRSRASGTTRTPRSRPSPTPSSSTSATSCPRWPAPSARRTACALHGAKDAFRAALADLVGQDAEEEIAHGHDEAIAETFPASDPPANGAPGHEPDPHEPVSAPAVAAGTVIAEHSDTAAEVTLDGETFKLDHGHVVIAAITSCTNTSNPSVMLGAGLLARNAVARGLTRQPWVKTSLAPGSKVVTEYLDRAGLTEPLEELGFNLVGYGCTTCIGNSGPLPDEISAAVNEARPRGLLGAERQPQLRGPHQPRREDELPRLAAAGGGLRDRRHDGHRPRRRPARASTPTATRSTSRTSGPRPRRSRRPSRRPCSRTCSARATARSSTATSAGTASRCPTGDRFAWDEDSTYVRQPPYFEGLPPEPTPVEDVEGARVLAKLGDSVTTDHISPAGSIKEDGPAGALPQGARRRAARLQLLRLAPRQPRGDDARHVRQHPPAQPAGAGHRGRRDARTARRRGDVDLRRGRWRTPRRARRWSSSAARSTARARRATGRPRAPTCSASGRSSPSPSSASTAPTSSGMGVLPLQYPDGESAESLGLTGEEEFSITGPGRAAERRRAAAHGHGARRRHGVRGARAHRHAQGGGLLPPRRHPAVRPALADGERRLMPAILICGDTLRSPELRHEVPLGIGDPFLYLETDGRRAVLTNVLEVDRIAQAGAGARAPARRAVRPRRADRRRAVVRGRSIASCTSAPCASSGSPRPWCRPTSRSRWPIACAPRASS